MTQYGYPFEKQPRLPNPKYFIPAVVAILVLFLIFFLSMARAEEIDVNALANAIGRAENSIKYPYGIKSINTYGNKEYARKICINSIRNNLKRWTKAGMPEDFITFMGRRFSPPAINPNWVRLVKYFYNRGAK